MKYFVLIIGFLLLGSLQSSLILWRVAPNLILIAVLWWAIKGDKEFKDIWPLVLIASLIFNLFSGLGFGIVALSFVLSIYFTSLIKKNVFGDLNFWSLISLVIIATLIYNLLLMILKELWQFDLVIDWSGYGYNLVRFVLVEALYNVIIFLIIFYGTKKISGQNKYFNQHRG